MFEKEIYDNVYGFIGVNQLELEIIDHPLFQRLKNIKQLGMAYTVFPGAVHTRFSHSLGVMYLVDKIGAKLIEDGSIGEDDLLKLRLVALLHDIGHYPLSHTIESSMLIDNRDANHEILGKEILNKYSISDILNQNYDSKEIGSIFNGESLNQTFNQLIHSELDVDRMDYLLRDSYNTGVYYGQFDYEQILRKMSVGENGLLCVDYKAVHAVENYITSRYYMYSQVYSHKTIGSFDQLVCSAYSQMEDENIAPDFKAIESMDEESFYIYDDHFIVKLLRDSVKQNENKYLKRMAEMILKREHLNLAYEVKDLMNSSDGKALPEYTLVKHTMENIERTNFGNTPNEWIFFDAPDTKFSKLRPYFDIEKKNEPIGEMDEAIYIKLKDKTTKPIVSLDDSIVKRIAPWTLKTIRVFTLEKYKQDIASKMKQIVNGKTNT